MGVKLQSALGGSVELNAPSTASNFTMTVPAGNGTVATTDQMIGFKNRIINGDMRIDQRNAGAILTQTNGTIQDAYCVDRWSFAVTSSGGGTGSRSVQRVTDVPDGEGFQYSIKVTTITALSSSRRTLMMNRIEGYNFADIAGKLITVSFWAKGTKSGNVTIRPLSNNQTPISISTSWAKYTITTTASSTALVDFFSGIGEQFQCELTDFTSAGDAIWLTGVQIETGTVASGFERRPYGVELALCQRYFWKSYLNDVAVGAANINGRIIMAGHNIAYENIALVSLPVVMRASPSVTLYNPSTGAAGSYTADANTYTVYGITAFPSSIWVHSSTQTIGTSVFTSLHLVASSEL